MGSPRATYREGGSVTPKELYLAARERISDPNRWMQGGYATNIKGHYTDSDAPDAVCWCSAGSIRSFNPPPYIARRVYDALNRACGEPLVMYNDNHTHDEVMDMWNRAEALLCE